MQFIIAFLIFFIIINIIGFIFSFLWPLILVLIVVVAVMNMIAYQKRKKAMKEFYQDVNETFQSTGYDHFHQHSDSSSDDIIDVEFTETDADEDR